MIYVATIIGSWLGGFVQGTAGFGSSIILMMFLPHFFGLFDAATISILVNVVLNLVIYWTYRDQVQIRKALLPATAYILTSIVATFWARSINVRSLEIIFGVFLIVLALYYWFVADRVSLKATPLNAIVCGGLSGLSGGIFSIGGPLMALYFLGVTDSNQEYVGTINLAFMLSSLVNAIVRLSQGFVGASLWPHILIASLAIIVGSFFGTRLAARINGATLRKIVYLLMILSGLNAIF